MLALTAALSLPAMASATILRVPGSWFFGPQAVWTDGTTNALFQPMGEPIPAAGLNNVRVSVELQQNAGNCKIRPALRWSADRVTWSNASPILNPATWQSGNGELPGTAYIDIIGGGVGTPKPWVQFGVDAANSAGTRVELCNATLLVEPKEK